MQGLKIINFIVIVISFFIFIINIDFAKAEKTNIAEEETQYVTANNCIVSEYRYLAEQAWQIFMQGDEKGLEELMGDTGRVYTLKPNLPIYVNKEFREYVQIRVKGSGDHYWTHKKGIRKR